MTVAADPEADREALAVFGPEGMLARVMPGFEYRPQQVEMAALVWHAFSHGRLAAVEAGTGTGKSLAYLYPGLHHARASRRPLIVSTNTINLQEQLLTKDLPLLAAVCPEQPKVALLLGRGNYLCRRRWESARLRGLHELPDDLLVMLERAVADGRGERGKLGFAVPEEAWYRLCSDGALCLRQRCPWASTCFWQGARRAASEAEIVLVNHHLLLADVAVRRALGWEAERSVLPAYDRVVFDEAHHLEDIATEYFSVRLSHLNLAKTLDRLHYTEGPGQLGALSFFRLGLPSAGAAQPPERLADARALAGQAVETVERARVQAGEFFTTLNSLARQSGHREGQTWQRRYREDLRSMTPNLSATAEDLALVLGGLGDLLGRLLEAWEGDNAETPETEEGLTAAAARGELMEFAANLSPVLEGGSREHVYWLEAERRRAGEEVAAVKAPLVVGPAFHEALLANLHSAVFASATLTVGREFAFFRERLGLDLVHPAERLELALDSPFDYERQVLLAQPADLPEPDAPDFPMEIASFLSRLLAVTHGRTLVLFTSFAALAKTHGLLQGMLPPGLRLLRQGERPRASLLAEFQRMDGAVLFGTDSFWEGVDVPGLALSCVVLARLPFRVPTEPIAEARMERLASEGGSPFHRYSLPQAIIKMRQGFGRLVRRQDDRGAVVVLDRRMLTKWYGAEFRGALPKCTECFAPGDEVVRKVGEWLGVTTESNGPIPGD